MFQRKTTPLVSGDSFYIPATPPPALSVVLCVYHFSALIKAVCVINPQKVSNQYKRNIFEPDVSIRLNETI